MRDSRSSIVSQCQTSLESASVTEMRETARILRQLWRSTYSRGWEQQLALVLAALSHIWRLLKLWLAGRQPMRPKTLEQTLQHTLQRTSGSWAMDNRPCQVEDEYFNKSLLPQLIQSTGHRFCDISDLSTSLHK